MKFYSCLFTWTFAILLGMSWPISAPSKAVTTIPTTGITEKYYVGADNHCDFNTIQAAIDAAGNSVNQALVLVSYNKTYTENLLIDHQDIHLDGRYPDCTQARLGLVGREKVTNQGFRSESPTIHITGLNVSIESMVLSDNLAGGLLADATSNITLKNMAFSHLGEMTQNGDIFNAIQLLGRGQINLQIIASDFSLNTAYSGSAIFCDGSNHSMSLSGSTFSDNEVNHDGGAIYVNGCDLTILDGVFQNNTAKFGGAVYVVLSDVSLNKTTFEANRVDGSGGAIAGVNSTINSDAVHFIDNQSTSFGGAVSLSSSTFRIKNSSNNCRNNFKCNLFSNNKAGFAGGAIGSELGFIDISASHFENNRADFGTAVYLLLTNSANVEGSVFVNNGNEGDFNYLDENVFFLGDTTSATISYSTFADNKTTLSTFNQEDNAELSVYSSIIYDPTGGVVFEPSVNFDRDTHCLIVHEIESFDASNNFITVADPVFVNPANGDFHIDAATSPAVDYCTDAMAMAQYPDIDNQTRGYDDPNAINNPDTNGTFDIGADEAHDLIFANGFE